MLAEYILKFKSDTKNKREALRRLNIGISLEVLYILISLSCSAFTMLMLNMAFGSFGMLVGWAILSIFATLATVSIADILAWLDIRFALKHDIDASIMRYHGGKL